ncbi:MAG TPA: ketoacyl-ACP synthase III [Nitrospirae bacterium]|nr:ketoacyl-ACP synthase III [Nitrospirota bacterium]HDL21213.1 ketoacyl-ACP synthase III [Nitrospirota bacterium]HDZ01416.1 ketoacyl-ACP synthase III [Nitrospirota bacterium]
MKSRITGTGSYVPAKILDNFDLEKKVDTSDEWIIERTGIRERRIVENDETTSDLSLEASKKALQAAGIKPKEIDLIIVATMTGDMPMPSTASFLQKKLGAKNAGAFDLNAACSGFLYGLSVADNFIKAGTFKKVLLVGAEVMSKFLDWKDRTTCVLFGDGAGAVVLETTNGKRGILSTHIYSDGNLWDFICLPGGGSKHPPSLKTIKNRMHFVKMKGNETFKIAVRTLEKLVVNTLKVNNVKPSELAMLIPHQANLRIISATAKRLKLPMGKVAVNLDKYGNTSSASIPIALDEVVRDGRIRNGDYILLEAFGSGLTWASALIKW